MPESQVPETPSRWIVPASQTRSRETLKRILEAAESLMANRSFREISIAEIALKAKTSSTAVYARFESKHALLGALFERYAAVQRERVATLLDLDRWRDVPLAVTLRQTFPKIVAGYRMNQSLIRAFLDQASEDPRFREAWSEVSDFIVERVTALVSARSFEVTPHPNLEQRLRLCLNFTFATLAHQIQMHGMDGPELNELTEGLIQMMLQFMGIKDVEGHSESQMG